MQTLRTGMTCLNSPTGAAAAEVGGRTATNRRGDRDRLTAQERREQLLRAASTQFAKTGLNATTTAALAAAAGVSEPILYVHFPDKESLFREVVRRNSERRMRALRDRMSSIVARRRRECIESILEATISVCLSADGGPLVTNWALLELPEFGADLLRQEVGSIATNCEEEFAARFPHEHRVPTLTAYLISFSIQACYSYALWLGTLRHTSDSAAPLVKQFSASAAESAVAQICAEHKRLRSSG